MRNDATPVVPPRQPEEGGSDAVRREPHPARAAGAGGGGLPRANPTGGRLRDKSLERSAREGEAPDITVLDTETGTRGFNVPLLMSAFALLLALLFVFVFFNWPEGTVTPEVPMAGQREPPAD